MKTSPRNAPKASRGDPKVLLLLSKVRLDYVDTSGLSRKRTAGLGVAIQTFEQKRFSYHWWNFSNIQKIAPSKIEEFNANRTHNLQNRSQCLADAFESIFGHSLHFRNSRKSTTGLGVAVKGFDFLPWFRIV